MVTTIEDTTATTYSTFIFQKTEDIVMRASNQTMLFHIAEFNIDLYHIIVREKMLIKLKLMQRFNFRQVPFHDRNDLGEEYST